MNETGTDVADIASINRFNRRGLRVNLVELPTRCPMIQVRHALAHHCRATCGNEQLQSRNMPPFSFPFAKIIEPQNANGQRRVDRCLRFELIDAEHGPRRRPLVDGASRIDRTERALEIDSRSERRDSRTLVFAAKNSFEGFVICSALRFLRRRCAMVPTAADFQLVRTWLPQSLHRQFQHFTFRLGVEYAANAVALLRPQMQHALAVIGGKGIARGLQIEECGPIFHDNGITGFSEEIVDSAS